VSDILRWLRLKGMTVDRESAISIARAECERRGLQWLDPVRVFRHYGDWSVVTAADHIPIGVRVIVDGGTGQVRAVNRPLSR